MSISNPAQTKVPPAWFAELDKWLKKLEEDLRHGLGTLIERSVEINFLAARKYSAEDVEALFPENPVCVTTGFSVKELGQWHFLFPQQLAAIISDLAMMGEGDAKFDEMLHPGTLAEIWGQVVATLETELKGLNGDELTVEMPEASMDISRIKDNIPEAVVVRWDLNVEKTGEGFLLMVIEPAFGRLFSPTEEKATTEPMKPESTAKKPTAAGKIALDEETGAGAKPMVKAAQFEDFGNLVSDADASSGKPRNINILMDVSLPITIELGRTQMLIRDVLELAPGSIIELDKLSGEPVDLYVNDKKFAHGEVVVIEENFGVRITELIKVEDRIKALR